MRPGPGIWRPVGRPEYLRQQTELALRKLKTERLDLLQLHRLDPQVPAAESYGVLAELQNEGKVASLGLSNVTVADIEEAGRHFTVATVQNRYNLTDGSSEDVLDHCTAHGIGFIPWAPISAGELAAPGGPVRDGCRAAGGDPGSGRPRLAAPPLTRHAADPGHGLDRAPGGEPGRRRARAGRRDLRGDHCRALIPRARADPQRLLGFVGLARSIDRADPTNPSSCSVSEWALAISSLASSRRVSSRAGLASDGVPR